MMALDVDMNMNAKNYMKNNDKVIDRRIRGWLSQEARKDSWGNLEPG